jgi:hypothetical protein
LPSAPSQPPGECEPCWPPCVRRGRSHDTTWPSGARRIHPANAVQRRAGADDSRPVRHIRRWPPMWRHVEGGQQPGWRGPPAMERSTPGRSGSRYRWPLMRRLVSSRRQSEMRVHCDTRMTTTRRVEDRTILLRDHPCDVGRADLRYCCSSTNAGPNPTRMRSEKPGPSPPSCARRLIE